MTDAVRYEVAGPVATLTLNRPGALNAINQDMRDGIASATAEAEADPRVRVVLVRGEGPRAFCAGADITEFETPGDAITARRIKHAATWIDALAQARKPVVAAIHGYCLGGGLEIALACDIRIAADDAQFALPEVSLAIIPGAGGTQRLSRAVGLAAALRLTLTAERVDAAEALRLGIVGEVLPAAGLADRASELAARIAGFAPQAVAYAKEAIRAGAELPLWAGIGLERDLAAVLSMTEDRREAAAAFRERRPAAFTGN